MLGLRKNNFSHIIKNFPKGNVTTKYEQKTVDT